MIFNEKFLFIHIGKTGGMSCSEYLLNNLAPTVYNCHADALKEVVPFDAASVQPLTGVGRHCTLAEALTFIEQHNGKTLNDFDKAVAVVRNPYAIEYSYYQHLRKPHIAKPRSAGSQQQLELAEGEFTKFVEFAGYHREGMRQNDFFQLDGKTPDKIELIRFEELTTALPVAIAPFRKAGPEHPFPHRNKSHYDATLRDLLTPAAEELIYHKHQYMFDSGIYARHSL